MENEGKPDASVIYIRSRNIDNFLKTALELFVGDPPENEFQAGFMTALLLARIEGLGVYDSLHDKCEEMLTEYSKSQDDSHG